MRIDRTRSLRLAMLTLAVGLIILNPAPNQHSEYFWSGQALQRGDVFASGDDPTLHSNGFAIV
jgi:hypothetical protein